MKDIAYIIPNLVKFSAGDIVGYLADFESGKVVNGLTVADELCSIYSDLHKDVYGCRSYITIKSGNDLLKALELINDLQVSLDFEFQLEKERKEQEERDKLAFEAKKESLMTRKDWTIGEFISL